MAGHRCCREIERIASEVVSSLGIGIPCDEVLRVYRLVRKTAFLCETLLAASVYHVASASGIPLKARHVIREVVRACVEAEAQRGAGLRFAKEVVYDIRLRAASAGFRRALRRVREELGLRKVVAVGGEELVRSYARALNLPDEVADEAVRLYNAHRWRGYSRRGLAAACLVLASRRLGDKAVPVTRVEKALGIPRGSIQVLLRKLKGEESAGGGVE